MPDLSLLRWHTQQDGGYALCNSSSYQAPVWTTWPISLKFEIWFTFTMAIILWDNSNMMTSQPGWWSSFIFLQLCQKKDSVPKLLIQSLWKLAHWFHISKQWYVYFVFGDDVTNKMADNIINVYVCYAPQPKVLHGYFWKLVHCLPQSRTLCLILCFEYDVKNKMAAMHLLFLLSIELQSI